jgi:hypothetical protein
MKVPGGAGFRRAPGADVPIGRSPLRETKRILIRVKTTASRKTSVTMSRRDRSLVTAAARSTWSSAASISFVTMPRRPVLSSIQVRPFRRSDRDQLTQLVSAHAEAVVPAMGVPVNTVLASLERQPGDFIEDPWVAERITLVAEQQNRVTAAAHLLRSLPGESGRPGLPGCGRDPLAALLARSAGRQSLLG